MNGEEPPLLHPQPHFLTRALKQLLGFTIVLPSFRCLGQILSLLLCCPHRSLSAPVPNSQFYLFFQIPITKYIPFLLLASPIPPNSPCISTHVINSWRILCSPVSKRWTGYPRLGSCRSLCYATSYWCSSAAPLFFCWTYSCCFYLII